jgi:hypothetical protein
VIHANDNLEVRAVKRGDFEWLLLGHHYARRVPSISFAFGLWMDGEMVGVVTFGAPASRHLQVGACPANPGAVIELNRLCVLDHVPRNAASWLIARALKMLPPYIVVSYADTVQGHMGFVYRAANFYYAGWTDMERKTPRYDYIVPGKHTRQAFRDGERQFTEKVRRRPKVKYWTVTGNRKERRDLERACGWPKLDWREAPPPSEHLQFVPANENRQAARGAA